MIELVFAVDRRLMSGVLIPLCQFSFESGSVDSAKLLQPRVLSGAPPVPNGGSAPLPHNSSRHVRPMGEGGQELQETGLLGLFHLGAITSYETAPLTLIGGTQPFFDKLLRRREIGKPHVIEITGSMLALGTPRGGRRTVPNRRPSSGSLGLPSRTTRIAIGEVIRTCFRWVGV